jgi:hypothetical protein
LGFLFAFLKLSINKLPIRVSFSSVNTSFTNKTLFSSTVSNVNEKFEVKFYLYFGGMDIQDDSKLLSGIPLPINFKSETRK